VGPIPIKRAWLVHYQLDKLPKAMPKAGPRLDGDGDGAAAAASFRFLVLSLV
jgi:hypothetical protein